MTESRSRFNKGATNLVLVCVAVIASILAAEAVLRMYAASSESGLARHLRLDPEAVLIEPHGDFGYRQRPNRAFSYANGTVANSNAQGYRGSEVGKQKPRGTFRVVLVGGSTTHGWGVNDDETIDAHMRRQLRREYPGGSFEVINLAFDGYDSYQQYERLKTDGLALDPDVVIVNTGINDVRNARYPDLKDSDARTMLWLSELKRLREERQLGRPASWTRLKHRSYTARLPGAARTHFSPRPADTVRVAHPEALEYFERNLNRIVDLARDKPVVVLFAIATSSLPTRYEPGDTSAISYWIGNAATTQAYRDSLDERLQRFVERAAIANDHVGRIPYIILSPDVFLDDAHLTSDGNAQVAAHFVAALRPILATGRPNTPVAAAPATRLELLDAMHTAKVFGSSHRNPIAAGTTGSR